MTFDSDEKGISLIEVVIALAILGLVAAAFLSGLATASKALLIADERTTAESLARSQMEHVKSQEYKDAEPGDVAVYSKIASIDIPEGYHINSLNRDADIVEEIVGIPWFFPLDDPEHLEGYAVDEDAGLQMIRLVIKHGDKEVIRLDCARAKRF